MTKPRYYDMLAEYSGTINDLRLSLFIPQKSLLHEKSEPLTVLHTHSYTEIFVCLDGELSIAAGDGEIKLHASDIAFLPSDCLHSAIISADKGFFTVGMIGEAVEFKGAERTYSELSEFFEMPYARVYRNCHWVAGVLREIHENQAEKGSSVPVIKMAAVLAELSCKEFEHVYTNALSGDGAHKRDVIRFLIIEDIINSSYIGKIDSNEIAAKLYITRRHLDRIVRERYGKTLRELVNEMRIKLSKELLCDSDLSIEKIANRVGYSTTLAFKNNFIRLVGISPSQYRRGR